jgi:hypothetical protein
MMTCTGCGYQFLVVAHMCDRLDGLYCAPCFEATGCERDHPEDCATDVFASKQETTAVAGPSLLIKAGSQAPAGPGQTGEHAMNWHVTIFSNDGQTLLNRARLAVPRATACDGACELVTADTRVEYRCGKRQGTVNGIFQMAKRRSYSTTISIWSNGMTSANCRLEETRYERPGR